MAYDHLQDCFAGGEISARLQGRVSDPLYKKGLASCVNFEPTPQGSILRAGGSIFQAALPNDPSVRLIPIRTSDEQDFILVLTGGALRIFSVQGGVLLSNPGSVQELIRNGGFGTGTTDWTEYPALSTTVAAGQARMHYVSGVVFPRLSQSVTLTSAQDVVIKFDIIAFSGSNPMYLQFGHGGISDGTDGRTQGQPTGALIINTALLAAGGARTVSYALHLDAGVYTLFIEGLPVDNTHDVVIDNVSISYALPGGADGLSIPAPWTSGQLAGVAYAEESAGNRVYLVSDDVAPYFIQKGDTGWSLQPITFATGSAPSEWGPGNWPSVVEFFQARLWLGATRTHRNTLWASRVGLPSDFTPTTLVDTVETVLPTDRITIPIATKGAIRWLRGRRNLLVGTDLGESSIAGAPVGPTSYQIIEESGFGASGVRAVDLGTLVAYVSRDRRKIRLIDYSLEAGAYVSRDLTFVNPQITAARVAEVHYGKDPNGTVVALLDDGTLGCCTFDRAEQVAAWWRRTFTGGLVLSGGASHGPDGSLLFLAVQRSTGIDLEMIPLSDLHPSRVYADAAVIQAVSATPTLDGDGNIVISGLDHLEGQVVDVVLGGAIEPKATVSGGTISLARVVPAGTQVIVGMPYTSTATTLPAGTPNGQGGVTALRAKRRWVKLFLRLFQSVVPFANGSLVDADRTPSTALDSPEPLYTSDVGGPTDGDWESRGQVTIETSIPLRCEVLALFGSVAEGEV